MDFEITFFSLWEEKKKEKKLKYISYEKSSLECHTWEPA